MTRSLLLLAVLAVTMASGRVLMELGSDDVVQYTEAVPWPGH